ncbi:hypothetical protein GGD65_005894 [Bradyrhizobium sp. CIR18]|uniref:hypothetical protein n=1 Tax=Bradyrhizobium sp. CIR18 TaxID=2663839 RepID=UPI0016060F96|nr:hypothetical protein [Bradyrhizobium sp. CIR18]MBB4364832.1 hypothetical protein [Bradyrhizobium sp. CIR18]
MVAVLKERARPAIATLDDMVGMSRNDDTGKTGPCGVMPAKAGDDLVHCHRDSRALFLLFTRGITGCGMREALEKIESGNARQRIDLSMTPSMNCVRQTWRMFVVRTAGLVHDNSPIGCSATCEPMDDISIVRDAYRQ